jgi:two-component system response regulator
LTGTIEDESSEPKSVQTRVRVPQAIDEVLKQIRMNPKNKRLPVVILTSSDEDYDTATSYDLGVNSCIRESIGFDRFVECVKQLGLYWLVLNMMPSDI